MVDHPTPDANAKRKLTAILHADVADYSRLMGEDEIGTHARLMACREVIGDLIGRHGGRVVGTAGDAVLADFPSVVEAIASAVDTQQALAERNAGVPDEQKLEFRIGINLGDVIVDGDDIFGDGVNVAARLESLADPGGIAISGAVYDQIRHKTDLTVRDRGFHRVKNIAEPVRVYSVGSFGGPATRPPAGPFRRPGYFAAAAALLVLLGGAIFWYWGPAGAPARRADDPAGANKPAAVAPTPGRPTIAVLPFEDRNGEAGRAWFSDGVTEDIIADLGRFSNLLVLSWNAVAPYKGRTVAPEQLRRDLRVRYVVGGTVRRAGDRLRITVQLTDAQRGVLLWSERYDKRLQDVFAVQDQITRQVVGALAVRLTNLEQKRSFRKPTDRLDAYDLVLRGRDLLRRAERSANLEAREMFRRAIKIDPGYADAQVNLGWTHMNDFLYGWTEWADRALDRAGDRAERAIRLDERNASAHALLAQVLRFQLKPEPAVREADRAVELNPNSAASHGTKGGLLMWQGQPEAAVPELELALRLDPRPLNIWIVNLAQCYYFLGRYDDTIRLLDRFREQFKEDPAAHALLAAVYGQLGRREEAAAELARLKRISPFFDARIYSSNFINPGQGRLLMDGFVKAGWK